MSIEAAPISSSRIIVVGNEKGGSGKSTVAMHIAIALIKSNHRVASIDIDSRQKTFTHYIENRFAWSQRIGCDLEIPNHLYFVENMDHPTVEDEAADGQSLIDQIDKLSRSSDYIVIDTPARDSYLGRLAHSFANILITPLNDSFVDLDVLGMVDRETLSITGTSHYAQMVEDARVQGRRSRYDAGFDWIVLRNRLSPLGSRNTRCVSEALRQLSQRLNFRYVEGLGERVIFREFYPRGLTALDTIEGATLGTRPTMSHLTSRLEIRALLGAIGLLGSKTGGETASRNAA
jgi:chromosome partitioning protein